MEAADHIPVGGNAGERLKSFIERVENVQAEIKGLKEDEKEIFGEAKATGFDVKTMRQIIKRRKMDPEKRVEQDFLLETYESAIDELTSMME